MSTPAPSNTATGGKAYTAPASQIWAWGLGAIVAHALIQVYGQASTIFTVGFGLSPVIIGWCMMFPRIIDGILDPIIGHWSDNATTRWGRRKPFLFGGALAGALMLMALWWADPAWGHGAQFTYLVVFGSLFYLAYGIYLMAWSALGYELTDDYAERSKVAAIGGLFLGLVTLGGQWTYWLALRPLFKNGVGETLSSIWAAGFDHAKLSAALHTAFVAVPGVPTNEIIGMRWISAAVGALCFLCALAPIFFCKERFTHVNRTHVPIGPALRTTVKNRPFIILVGFKICQILGERAALGLLIYLAIYYVCGGDKSTGTQINGAGATIGTVLGFCVLPLLKPITQWIGKRKAQISSATITFSAALLLPFILTPSHPWWLIIPFMIGIPLGTLNSTLTSAMLPDICDVDELENGQRREGLFTAVLGFVSKLEISLCYLVVGYCLSFSGFDAKLPLQSPDVLHRLYWFCVIPNITFTLIGLILTIRFPVTAPYMADVRRQLDERRLEKAAVGEPTDEVAEQFVQAHPEIVQEVLSEHPPADKRPPV